MCDLYVEGRKEKEAIFCQGNNMLGLGVVHLPQSLFLWPLSLFSSPSNAVKRPARLADRSCPKMKSLRRSLLPSCVWLADASRRKCSCESGLELPILGKKAVKVECMPVTRGACVKQATSETNAWCSEAFSSVLP
mmetsp:Transcript_30760/g.56230  ORF Transcript_30760/g.56230 Transcript_30760/m.56230 type:complete len:135 (-) Transcript_30760:96-500(-)